MSSVEALQKCLRDKLETMSGFGDEKKQIKILKKFFEEFDTDGSGCVARQLINPSHHYSSRCIAS